MISELTSRLCAYRTIVIAALTLHSVTTPTLPLSIECPHFPLPFQGSSYPHCIEVSQFSGCRYPCEVWPAGKSDHRALLECWAHSQNYVFSHGGRVGLNDKSMPTFQSPSALHQSRPSLSNSLSVGLLLVSICFGHTDWWSPS